jgi:hypothetical protein
MRDHRKSESPDVAEFIIGRAFARPGGSSGLRLLSKNYGSGRSRRPGSDACGNGVGYAEIVAVAS